MEVSFSVTARERRVKVSEYSIVREAIKSTPGVYVFYLEGGHALYVGMSKNLARRLDVHVRGRSHVDLTGAVELGVFITNSRAEADMLETYLINSLKPDLNISKASFPEFLVDLDERLLEVEVEINDLREEIAEELAYFGDEDTLLDDEGLLAQELELIRAVKTLRQRETLLKRKAGTLKMFGAVSLRNVTAEEEIRNYRLRRKMAYLRGRGRIAYA